jgi:hypothetical protein
MQSESVAIRAWQFSDTYEGLRDNRSGQLWLNWLESNVIPLVVIR